MNNSDVFGTTVQFPDSPSQAEFDRLVGIDQAKERLVKEALLLLDPGQLVAWNKKCHNGDAVVLDYFASRPPLFVLAGDVGTGKTALARSFGSEVSGRARGVQIQLHSLSLSARGSGAVGEMTRLISGAFQRVREAVATTRGKDGKAGRGIILLIDEADALAQSRDAAQMHHEDRAGVNALIRGVDDVAIERLPIVIVMCTNRLDALDPAVRRRAAAVFEFERPNRDQRLSVLRTALRGTSVGPTELEEMSEVTGTSGGRSYGCTYSDLTQRLIPTLVLDAFPERPLTGQRSVEIARAFVPTPPFRAQGS